MSLADMIYAAGRRRMLIREGIELGELQNPNRFRAFQLMWQRLEHELQRRTVKMLNDGCSLVAAKHVARRCKRAAERADEAFARYRDEIDRHNEYVRNKLEHEPESNTTIN